MNFEKYYEQLNQTPDNLEELLSDRLVLDAYAYLLSNFEDSVKDTVLSGKQFMLSALASGLHYFGTSRYTVEVAQDVLDVFAEEGHPHINLVGRYSSLESRLALGRSVRGSISPEADYTNRQLINGVALGKIAVIEFNKFARRTVA